MTTASPLASSRKSVARWVTLTASWHRLALEAILLLGALFNLLNLGRIGLGNTYYAAAVKSMMQSWHNLFFVSFDPGGFVTIDKPPLAFWMQTAAAKLFGFGGVSLVLPQALAGILSIWLMYMLVARVSGRVAGLIAALVMAITPVLVLVDRSNLVESILVLAMLLAAWAAVRAVETNRLRWMLLAAAFIGVGFNVKSLEAYLAAPAIFLVYLVGARVRPFERVWHLALAAVVLGAVSLSWVTAVDLTPASMRPYVASSGDNSELGLALGYNGLGRLTGNTFAFLRGGASVSSTLSDLSPTNLGFSRGETGAPGVQRLVNAQLGGQTSWLLLPAIVGVLAVLAVRRPRWPLDLEASAAVLWGGWLVTAAAFFSIAGFFHAYYLATLAPPVAALTGMSMVTLWRQYWLPGWRGWMLPVTLAAAAAIQADILSAFPSWNVWLTPLVVGGAVLAALVLGLLRVQRQRPRFAALGAVAIGLGVLVVAPFVWSEYTVAHASGNAAPSAGPPGPRDFGPFGAGRRFGGFRPGAGRFPGPAFRGFRGRGFGGRDATANPALIRYLQQHRGSARFLVATLNAGAAEPFILSTGQPVMDLGGFMGGDRILNPSRLAALVRRGTVRYFFLGGSFGGFRPGTLRVTGAGASTYGPGRQSASEEVPVRFRGGFGADASANADLVQWVSHHCRSVPPNAYGAGSSAGLLGQTLYSCPSR